MKYLREVRTTTDYYSIHVTDDFDMEYSISSEGEIASPKTITFRTDAYGFFTIEIVVDYDYGYVVVEEVKENLMAIEEVFAGEHRLSENETFDYWNRVYNKLKDYTTKEHILHIMLEYLFMDMHEEWDGNIERVRKELEGSHEPSAEASGLS